MARKNDQQEKLSDNDFRDLLKIKQQEMIMMKNRGYSSSNMLSSIAGVFIEFKDEENPFLNEKVNVQKMKELRKEKGFFNYREDFTADYYIGPIEKPTRKAKVIYIDKKNALDIQIPGKKTKEKNRDTGIEYINNAMAAIAAFESGAEVNAGAAYDEIVIIVKSKLTHNAKMRTDSWLVNKTILTDNDMLFPLFDHAYTPQFVVFKDSKKFKQNEDIDRINLKPLNSNEALCSRLGLERGNILLTIGSSPIFGKEVHYFKILGVK